ncbi:MAG TPA: glycosyltransferase [Thermoguttaceae bacterium]|nr:glycosyltransferase [Thermoguttaceae bacterium]
MRAYPNQVSDAAADRPAPAGVDIGVIYTHEDGYMPRLLSSLAEACGPLDARLILVDNASQNGVTPWLKYFPNTTVLRNTQRLHYSANLNRILWASTRPYSLLLNADMYFEQGERCVEKMVDFMQRNPGCGIAGCRLYHEDRAFAFPARRFQTLPIIVARRLHLGRFLRGTLNDYFYREHAEDETWESDWLSGCFLMVRRAAFEEVGGFDEKFLKYFEDVDMCLRMARAGWRVLYNGQTFCYHVEQRASAKLLSNNAMIHLRSYMRWLYKWGFSPARAIPRQPDRVDHKETRRAA